MYRFDIKFIWRNEIVSVNALFQIWLFDFLMYWSVNVNLFGKEQKARGANYR